MRFFLGLCPLLASCTIGNATEPYVNKLKGKYALWEDFEGGKVCKVTLKCRTDHRRHRARGDARYAKRTADGLENLTLARK